MYNEEDEYAVKSAPMGNTGCGSSKPSRLEKFALDQLLTNKKMTGLGTLLNKSNEIADRVGGVMIAVDRIRDSLVMNTRFLNESVEDGDAKNIEHYEEVVEAILEMINTVPVLDLEKHFAGLGKSKKSTTKDDVKKELGLA